MPVRRFEAKKRYSLKYLAPYLAESGQYDRLYQALLCDRQWMQRKFEAFSDYSGYLEDLEVALGGLTEPLEPAGILVAAQISAARIVTRLEIESYSEADITLLVLEGRREEALSRARLRLYPELRCRDLLAIHRVLRRQRNIDRDLLLEIHDRAFSVKNDRERAYAFIALGVEWALSGFLEESRGSFDDAETAFTCIPVNYMERNFVLQTLSVYLAQAGFFARAMGVLRIIECEFFYAWTLAEMACFSPDDDVAHRLTVQAEALGYGVEGEGYVLPKILETCMTRRMERDFDRITAKLRKRVAAGSSMDAEILAIALAKAGRCEEAQEVMEKLEPGVERRDVLAVMAEAWGKKGRLDCALAMIEDISDAKVRSQALQRLALALAESGRFDEARPLLEQARVLNEPGLIPRLLAEEMKAFGQPEILDDEMVEAAAGEDKKKYFLRLALRIAHMAGRGDQGSARALLREVEAGIWPITTESSCENLLALARAYARLGEPERRRVILCELSRIRDFMALDSPSIWAFDARSLARSAVECGAFLLAFKTLEILPSKEIFQEIAAWAPYLESLGQGLAVSVRNEIARIIAWRQ